MDYKINYKGKYLKYRQKYLNLKNQIGGAKELYLPCEISCNIKKTYYETELNVLLWDIDLISTKKINVSNHEVHRRFIQDPIIFLKSKVSDEDFIIKIKEGFDLSSFKKDNIKEIPYISGNDYGGNFISSPPNQIHKYGSIFCFNQINPLLSNYLDVNLDQNVIELKCTFRYNNERHIDECMCFMPYKDKYKVWIYCIRYISEEIVGTCNIPEIHKILEDERQHNLNLISNELFGSNYELNINKFVEFSIDLKVDKNNNFKIINPPIFNRIWYETDTECRVIFSDPIDGTILPKVNEELKLIGSINGIKNFKAYKINTLDYHNEEGAAGGNLHCLIKNIY
jgi:hypothetical protein